MAKYMEPQDLVKQEKDIARGSGRGIYLVGDDIYLKERLVNAALSRADGPMGAMNKSIFQGNELSDSKKLFDDLLQFPSMAAERVIVIRSFEKCKKKLAETLADFTIPDTSFLVLEAEKGGGNNKWFKTLKKKLKLLEVNTPPTYKMNGWVDLFSKEYKIKLDSQASNYLIDSAGISLFNLKGELEKLSLLLGQDKNLRLSDIEEVISHSRQRSIFDFTDALMNKNTANLLHYLNELIHFGESTATILFWIGRTINEIAYIKGGITTGIHPYKLKKLQPAARKYSDKEIVQAIMTVYRADMLIKTGKMKDHIAVHWATGKIISSWK